MKCQIPQISWHGRDPVLSIDFQMCTDSPKRLATGGTDSHVLMWYVSLASNNSLSLQFASDLNRHNKPVNIVRFSPNGEMLASGDDESIIILWKLSDREIMTEGFNDEENVNKEQWYPMKVLRGHLDDICDLSWSPDSCFLLSGSVDNTAIIWDTLKGKKTNILSDYGGFVQGVTWDPQNQYLASLSSDRILRIHSLTSKKVLHKVQKAALSVSSEKSSNKPAKLFYDDTLKSFCRRLCFSTDGELLIVPSGIIDHEDGKFQNTTYVFTRCSLNKPVLHLPTGSKYTLAVRCSPILYKLRERKDLKNSGEHNHPVSLFDLPYRLVYAVATEDSVLFYDTQQPMPFAHVSNIHYTHLTDLAWSPDGQILIASSTDGYCSFIIFSIGEIGDPYVVNSDVEGSSDILCHPAKPLNLTDVKNVKPSEKRSGLVVKEKSVPVPLNTMTSKDHLLISEIIPDVNTSGSATKKSSIKSYLYKAKELPLTVNVIEKNDDDDVKIINSKNKPEGSKISFSPREVSLVKEMSSVNILCESESVKCTAPVVPSNNPLDFKTLLLSNNMNEETNPIVLLGSRVVKEPLDKGDVTHELKTPSTESSSNLPVPSTKSLETASVSKPGRRIQLFTITAPKKT